MTIPWAEEDTGKAWDEEDDGEYDRHEDTLAKGDDEEDVICCLIDGLHEDECVHQKNKSEHVLLENKNNLSLVIEISTLKWKHRQYFKTRDIIYPVLLLALILMSVTLFNVESILHNLYCMEILKSYPRDKMKYRMSKYLVQENIRHNVIRFFKETSNLKLKHFSIKHMLNIITEYAKRKSPTVYLVYPAYTLGEYYRELESNPNMSFQERMKYGILRTSTFSKFPQSSPVSPLMLAKAGFYYEGETDEVICFKCGIKHRNWKHLDDPVQIHRDLSPLCPFVTSLQGGHPMCVEASDRNSTEDDTCILYQREDDRRKRYHRNRMKSGSSNNCHESPLDNGKIPNVNNTCNSMDSIKVPILENTEENKVSSISESQINAVETGQHYNNGALPQSSEERNNYPSMSNPAIQSIYLNQNQSSGNTNVPTLRSNNFSAQNQSTPLQNFVASSTSTSPASNTTISNAHIKTAASTLEPLGISIERPKYPQYAVLSTRISSFRNWPEHLHQKPEELAKAGFLYEGTNDFTRCFFCAGGLRDWEPEDHPWIEHARWYKNCVFVRQCKGEDFVNLVQQGKIQEAMGKLKEHEVFKKEQFDDILKSTASLSVQEMGYSIEHVRKAIMTLSKHRDVTMLTAESLLQYVWELEERDKNDTNSQDDSNIHQSQNTKSGTSGTTEALLAENRQLKEQQICKICMDEDISIVFLPCGHMATCVNCAPAVRKCPLCRKFIKGTVKAILS